MKLNQVSQRMIEDLLKNYPDTLEEDTKFLDDLNLSTTVEQRYNHFLKQYSTDISLTLFRKIWRKIELFNFLEQKLVVFTVKSQVINLRSVRRKLKRFLKNERVISIQIYNEPQIILIGQSYQSCNTLQDKMSTHHLNKDIVYWLPEEGMLFSAVRDDTNGKQFVENLQHHLEINLTQFRFKAYHLRNFFMKNQVITNLKISAEASITGFSGLDFIQFSGEHIKKGANGLMQRQEVNIQGLDRVGPNIEVSSPQVHLFIGPYVIVNTLSGISTIIEIVNSE